MDHKLFKGHLVLQEPDDGVQSELRAFIGLRAGSFAGEIVVEVA